MERLKKLSTSIIEGEVEQFFLSHPKISGIVKFPLSVTATCQSIEVPPPDARCSVPLIQVPIAP